MLVALYTSKCERPCLFYWSGTLSHFIHWRMCLIRMGVDVGVGVGVVVVVLSGAFIGVFGCMNTR